MKNKRNFFTLLLLVTCCCFTLRSQSAVFENKTLESKILNKSVRYSVYLPDGYADSDRAYPVLYLLHGAGGSHLDWVRNGNMKVITDKCVAEGTATEMIVVMPDAGDSWYVNDAAGKSRFEDMFFEELIPFIETRYRVIAEKRSRAVAGLSMGGYGALIYTLRHPDAFIATFAMSAAVRTDEDVESLSADEYVKKFGDLYGAGKAGAGRLTPHWRQYDVLTLIRQLPEGDRRKIKIFATCGDDDHLYHGNGALWSALRDAKIPYEFRVEDGAHTWSYWRRSYENYLPVLSGIFNN